MNKNDFLSLIGSSAPVDKQVLTEISDLVNIFPYFQTAHLLLLKGLKDNSDIRFENQLRNSAIHVADREVLYNFLKVEQIPLGKEILDEQEDKSEEAHVEVKTFVDIEQTVIESAKNSEDLINEIEKYEGGLTGEEKSDRPDQILGRTILLSVESEIDEPERSVLGIDDEPSDNEDNVFFMDPGFSIPEYNDLLELELETNDALTSEEDNKTAKQTGSDEFSKKSISQSELIDKFILANPRIEPVRETGKQIVEDISKPFTEVEGGFVTETLAKIYINQGYYSKAIDIYEKLSLKFPEKSSYFASQIEIVKEYLKK